MIPPVGRATPSKSLDYIKSSMLSECCRIIPDFGIPSALFWLPCAGVVILEARPRNLRKRPVSGPFGFSANT
jgi:hypothetical protein